MLHLIFQNWQIFCLPCLVPYLAEWCLEWSDSYTAYCSIPSISPWLLFSQWPATHPDFLWQSFCSDLSWIGSAVCYRRLCCCQFSFLCWSSRTVRRSIVPLLLSSLIWPICLHTCTVQLPQGLSVCFLLAYTYLSHRCLEWHWRPSDGYSFCVFLALLQVFPE